MDRLRDLWDYLAANWRPIVAYATILWALISYFLTRRRELNWKRTEFLFTQAHYLDNDPHLQEVVTILEGRHSMLTVEKIFATGPELEPHEREQYKQRFDKLLNLFQRLAYVVSEPKTIRMSEMASFGWYYERILQYPLLVRYCMENGFHEIVEVAKKLTGANRSPALEEPPAA